MEYDGVSQDVVQPQQPGIPMVQPDIGSSSSSWWAFSFGMLILWSATLTLALIGSTFLRLVFVHNVTVIPARHIFNAVFTCAGLMFVMVLCDLAEIVTFRQQVLLVSLMSCLVLSTLVVPALALSGLWQDIGVSKPRLKYAFTIGTLLTLYFFVGKIIPTDDVVYEVTSSPGAVPSVDGSNAAFGPPNNTDSRQMTFGEHVLAGAAYLGVAIMAVLGGFAAVATPLAYLAPFFQRNNLEATKALCDSLAYRLQHITDAWLAKRRDLAVLLDKQRQASINAGGNGAANGGGRSGGWGGITGGLKWFSDKLGMRDRQADTLRVECEGLEQIATSLYLQLHEAEEAHNIANFGRSIRAILFATFGLILSFYCIGKVLLTIFNLFFRRFSTVDPVTRFFTLAAQFTGYTFDVAAAVDKVALGFNAAVTLSAIRGLLVMVFRITTKHLSGLLSANTTVLFFSTFVGLHFIAMLLLMRLSLPAQNRSALTEVIGPLPFYYYHRWHDTLFVLSAIGTGALKRLLAD